ncbi:hypothetical protein DYB26_009617 [Aphanomyces astaci]|uniref:beta-glucosidase n=1 Tax=Aphanomyces astaci TaxID=112090 RepID=A0A3R7AM26_APHAT|nr:hypothetical protein DYB26_009617 [Aphanomyces astaci]
MKVLLALVALPYATGATDFNAEAKVVVDGMTIDELIGQMTQVNINYGIQDQNAKKVVDPSKVEELANQRIGSYLNSPFSLSTAANVTGWSATEWRSAISQIQTTHKATTGHPIIYGHYIGYSGSASGKDRDPVTLSKHELLNIFMLPFKAVIDAGIMTGMDSYIALNGVPTSANRQTSIDLLRTDLKFDGFLVSDWEEIYMMEYFHKYATDRQGTVFKVMSNSSLDMSMVPTDTSFIGYMRPLYDSGKVSLDRIRKSAQRIVKVKLQLNLHNDPVLGADLANALGDFDSQSAALETAKASLVLVKNTNNVLPLDPAKYFYFTGPSIDDIGLICGGWTIHWQGVQGTSNFPAYGRTIQADMSGVVGNATRAQFYQGVNIDGTWWDINLAKQKAQADNYTVIGWGSGHLAAAVLNAGLPCELGGEAISSVLFGSTNPSGKLPLTYPKSTDLINLATPYYGRAEKKMRWATECQHLKNELIDAAEAIRPQARHETNELKGSLYLKDHIIAQLKRDFAEINTVLSTSCSTRNTA